MKPPLVIRCTGYLFAAFQVQTARFPNFCYFFSQFSDALFDWPLHEDRLAEHCDIYNWPNIPIPLNDQRLKRVIAFYEKVIKVKADVAAFLN